MVLNLGDEAPDFSLPGDDGQLFSLSSFRNKNKVVLYFYPKDDTPGCTTEAKDFRDQVEHFYSQGVIIAGISKDPVSCHANFKQKYSLPFFLLSDEKSDIVQQYGAWVKKNMFGKEYMGIERSTFLIDDFGKIAFVWRAVKVKGHALEVLERVKSLNTGL